MKVEVLYFDGCPTYETATKTLRRVLAEEGLESDFELVAVNSDEEARRLRFPGSPTTARTAAICSPRRKETSEASDAECTQRQRGCAVTRPPRCSGKR
jgi:hypothetical protein